MVRKRIGQNNYSITILRFGRNHRHHLTRSDNKGFSRKMFDISGYEECLFRFAFFHYYFIKDYILRIGKLSVFNAFSININAKPFQFTDYIIHNIFRKAEFGSEQNGAIFINDLMVK